VTEKDGTYSFGNLRPGQYVVHTLLQPTAKRGSEAPPIEAYLPQYYPNAGDFTSAARLDLRGLELRADFVLSRGRVFSVSGSVKGLLNPYSFHCQFADAAGQLMTATGWQYSPDTAQFAILMPAGLWTLWCDGSDGTTRAYATREIKVESSNIRGLELELRQPFDIPLNEYGAHLSRIDPPTAGLAPEPDYVPVPGAIRGVPPGKYRVKVPSESCVASVSSGNTDLLYGDLVVADGAQPVAIRVSRFNKCPTLGGTIHADSGDPWGVVLLVSDSDHIEPAIVPFNQGRFNTPPIIPGTYHVYAFRSLNELEYANLDALREYPSQTVRLEKDQHAIINLELIQKR